MRSVATSVVAACILSGCAAASTQSYKTPLIKGDEPMIVISGMGGFTGSGCLATIMIDGQVAGTVGSYETLAIKKPPGRYFVRWDIKDGGICGDREDLARRLVTVTDRPLMLKLDIGGVHKTLIPVFGAFTKPDYRILLEGEE